MERYRDALELSKEKLQLADHLLHVTYSHLKDSKILLLAAENLYLSCSKGMDALLLHSLTFKNIDFIPSNFYGKLNTIRNNCSGYGLDESYISMIQEIKFIVDAHKKSPIEFSRKSSYIICDERYNMKELSRKNLEGTIEKAKLFINKVTTVISNKH
jgi:hypothetical protein